MTRLAGLERVAVVSVVGYDSKDFVAHLRRRKIARHVAMIESRKTPGLDARTTRYAGCAVSQRNRKRVEEIFGWMDAYGGSRRTLVRGLRRVQVHAYLLGAAYNPLRFARLRPLTGRFAFRYSGWSSSPCQ